MTTLSYKDLQIQIDKGELVSLKLNQHQYIHQKGSPGWRSADTEMFPVIGPTAEAGYVIQTPRGEAVQDQHGLLRELEYVLLERDPDSAVFEKTYRAGTLIKNSKFPNKSTEEFLSWPYDFTFSKHFELSEGKLSITFKVKGETGMPFMLGYHPAFKIQTINPKIITSGRTVELSEILAAGSRALQVSNQNKISLQDKKELKMETEGFSDFMLWTEVPNMVCIEPVTFYPYAVEQNLLHTGFQKLGQEAAVFKVFISV